VQSSGATLDRSGGAFYNCPDSDLFMNSPRSLSQSGESTSHEGVGASAQSPLERLSEMAVERRTQMPLTPKGGTGRRSNRRAAVDRTPLSIDQRIRSFVEQGLTLEPIMSCMGNLVPELVCIIEEKRLREKAAAVLGVSPVPKWDEQRHGDLYRQIGKVMSAIRREGEATDIVDAIAPSNSKIYRSGDLKPIPYRRIPSGYPFLDYVLGRTKQNNESGFVRGMTTVCGGQRGIGKTRTFLHVARNVGNMPGEKVLYFQNETLPDQFSAMMEGVIPRRGCNFGFSLARKLSEQIAIVKAEKPTLVIVDSLHMIEEARTDAGKERVIASYKAVLNDIGAHVVFIAQLNKAGQIKGTTALEHLVDVVLLAARWQTNGQFVIKCEDKNRFGPAGRQVTFKHTNEGIVCTSQGKLTDDMELIDEASAITLIEGIRGAGGDVADIPDDDDDE